LIRSKRQRRIIKQAFKNGYDVDVKRGRVFLKSGKWTYGIYNKKLNYMMVSISLPDGPSKGEMIYVHRLIAYKKYGNKLFDPLLEVRHKNNDGTNNRGRNLLLGTRLENIMDMPAELRSSKSQGIRVSRRLFIPEQARKILRSYNKNILPFGKVKSGTFARLGRKYKKSAAQVRNFIHNGGYDGVPKTN
jgi:hypothetical protein